MTPAIDPSHSLPGPSRRRGFSLVVTVTVLLLLAVVALGMLTLSTLTVRTATAGGAQSEARANARLALTLAIGELQKSLGPDQRVSANGAILSDPDDDDSTIKHSRWTGVWDSWRAGILERGTTTPDGYSRHETIAGRSTGGMHPTYVPNRRDHFHSWLVSLQPDEATELSTPLDLELDGSTTPDKDAEAVQLVGEGSLGPESGTGDRVSARLLETASGRYAWWVGDESQKARLSDDSYLEAESSLTLADRLFRHQAPGSTGTTAIEELADLTDEELEQLAGLPSLRTLDLVDGATGTPSENFHAVTPFSYQVLADVREGGLKRDLTTLLERPIREGRDGRPAETSEEFMLYKFDTKDRWASSQDLQECVPIHDLAAYYQLYDGNRSGWKKGVQYSSTPLRGAIQAMAPDFGSKQDDPNTYLRNYTSLYRHPVPIKIQFLLSMYGEPRSRSEITRTNPDTHKLHLGITPAVTLWNPSNLPVAMNLGDPDRYAYMFRLMNMPINVRWIKNGGEYKSEQGMHMTWATQQAGGFKANIFSLYFSGTRQIVFEPGEVKVFSLPYRPGNMAFRKTDRFTERHEVEAGWDPTGFLELHRSDRSGNARHVADNSLTFKSSDKIAFEVDTDNTEIYTGAGMKFLMIQASYQQHGNPGRWDFRHYQHISRFGRGTSTADFNANLYRKGMPGRGGVLRSEPRTGSQIIARTAGRNPEPWPFLQVALMAGCETHEASNGGAFAGRKFASRPFLHSTAISPSFIDRDDHDSFYNYGWNWWVEDINSVFEANVQVSAENRGYYGGGYTPESGSTHVVQQEIPVVPPMAIAALSHAHLGGFSIATESCAAGYQGLTQPFTAQSWQHVTATGQAGLFPHTLQAIGNSYAHPHIPADEAFTTWERLYSADEGARPTILADHSYLANKALWDEFFFSSIHPERTDVKVFETPSNRSAEEVAEEFFFGDDPLPNRRMVPYTNKLNEDLLGDLFDDALKFRDGLADRIAAHLLVEGPFNVNSTSVEAWRIFFSSLKGKRVSYLDKDKALRGGVKLDEAKPEGTPVSSFSLPNGEPVAGATDDPSDEDQWFGWRELSDDEITELAEAMVEQVKLRGPFLSLSDFVNRRLDDGDPELAVKGALQAALDDEKVSINEGFRSAARKMTGSELGKLNPEFKEALEGPVAYGSAAYVDQADVLRHFAGQLTPRGDTFVIRTYGDSLDAAGNVKARAWCEAVVQRVPDYLDPVDDSHLPQAELRSEMNKSFGRALRVVSFRWLKPSEV